MKILYFVNSISHKGGIDRIVVDKMSYLVEQFGYDVTVCTVIEHSSTTYPHAKGLKHIPLLAANAITPPLKRLIRPLRICQRVREIIRQGDYDVVVNAQARYVTWILPFINRRIPKIMEIHFSRVGMEINMRTSAGKFRQWIYWHTIEYFYSRYDRFVVLSKGDSAYWPLRNVQVIYNFTRCVMPEPPERREHVILCLARYQHQKRLDLLLRAWQQLYQQFPDWKVEIYGQGTEKAHLQQLVDEAGVHDTFLLHDAIVDVVPAYARSSIFALTSEHEGFGLVLLEAMAARLPTCAFNIVGGSVVVDNGKTGLLCDFPDVTAFAHNLARLMEDESLRRAMGEEGYARLQLFRPEYIMQEWKNLFEEVIAHRMNCSAKS
jgi:glycosyltransferase involved in cell wall biosynthesis